MKTNKNSTKTQVTANAATVSAPAAEPQKLLPPSSATTAAEPAPVPVADTTADQPALPVAKIALTLIDINPRNPRQTNDQSTIEELAQNIRNMGLISPITVREVNGRFMIVCGERRYKAHLLLGRSHINAYVSDIDEAKAYDLSVSENLHREDIAPMDAAAAYKYLIAEKGMTVEAIALHYGKSEKSIYKAIKLNDLIPELADHVRAGHLPALCGITLAKYDKKVQQAIHKDHFADPAKGDWWDLRDKALDRKIVKDYTNKLDDYQFDKTKCQTCAHNSQLYNSLFADMGDCARCTNRKCLADKQTAWLADQARAVAMDDPKVILIQGSYGGNDAAVCKLKEDGYDFKEMETYNMRRYPSLPTSPKEADFQKPDDYQKAQKRYGDDMKYYNKGMADIDKMRDEGKVQTYARIGHNGMEYYYKDLKGKTDPALKTPAQAIGDLRDKKKRNNELAMEKTVADLKELLNENTTAKTEFTALEESMLYYFMLTVLRKTSGKILGVNMPGWGRLDEEQRIKIVAKLTEQQKTIIRRDYIYSFVSGVFSKGHDCKMLIDFAKLHHPEKSAVIYADHKAVYDKRNNRLDERIAEIEAREKVAAKMEKPATKDKAAKGKAKAKPAPKGKAAQAQPAA